MAVTLYYSPFACSLSCHIALKAAKVSYNIVKVDLSTKKTENGDDYLKINPTGAVPALQFEDGSILTQNIAILSYIGAISKHPNFYFEDTLKQARLIEAIAFDGDIHTAVASHIYGNADDTALKRRIGQLDSKLSGDSYLLGTSEPTTADIYAAVILNWTTFKQYDLSPWPKAAALHKKVFESEVAQQAIKEETA